MKVFLLDQRRRFKKHLDDLKAAAVTHYDRTRLTERVTSVYIDTGETGNPVDLDVLFDYRVFPTDVMTSYPQWSDEHRRIAVGDTIVQQVNIPPVTSCSLKLMFGARVCEIIDEDDRKGFSYESLTGYVEIGLSTFTVERQDHGHIFRIRTHSEPATALVRLLRSLVSVPTRLFAQARR